MCRSREFNGADDCVGIVFYQKLWIDYTMDIETYVVVNGKPLVTCRI
jgi:hypothetical protein